MQIFQFAQSYTDTRASFLHTKEPPLSTYNPTWPLQWLQQVRLLLKVKVCCWQYCRKWTPGFHTEGVGALHSPRNLEIGYGYYCVLFGKFVPDCVWSNLRGSKFKIFPERGGICPQTPLVATHVSQLLSSCYHPATILFPPSPNSKSCMKSWTPVTGMLQEMDTKWHAQFPPYSAQSFLNSKEPPLSSTAV